ncbi:MAG: GntR family transcriptional regulator [Bacillota bacterium]
MLDPSSDKSIYVQVAEIIENEILLGNLKEEEQAPSTNQFAKVYQINPATAGKGLNMLADEGILYKKRGLGMFVREGAKEKIIKKRQALFLKETLPEVLREADRLEITVAEIVDYIKELRGGV